MKPFVYLFLLLLILTSCKNRSDFTKKMKEAEQYMDVSPCTALGIIDSLDSVYFEMSIKEQSAFVLLKCSMAYQNKSGYPFTDQIYKAKEYFEDKKDHIKEVQTGLFLAICLQKENNPDASHKEYIENLEKAIRYQLYNEAAYLSSHLADFYYARNDLHAALLKYIQANEYFNLTGNQLSTGFSYRDIGRTYCMLDSVDRAVAFMLKADSIADIIKNTRLKASVYNGLGNIALHTGDYKEAISYLEKGIRSDSVGYISNMLSISDIYIENEQYQKAVHILETLNEDVLPDRYKRAVLYNYYLIYLSENDYENALLSLEEFFDLFQKNLTYETDNTYSEVEKRYNHLSMVNKLQKLTIKNQRFVMFIIALITLLLLLFIVYYYFHIKNKRKLYDKDKELKDTQIQILNLSLELEKHTLESENPNQQEYLYKEAEIKALKQKLKEIRDNLIYYSPLRKDLIKKIKSNKYFSNAIITDKIWLKIESEIEMLYPGFISILKKDFPSLTAQEIQYCALCIYGFETHEEAILIGINPESVRKRRTRIREKLNVSLINSNLHTYLKNYYL